MTTPVSGISVEAQNFNWLVSRFAQETAGVVAAIAVSSDGLLVAMSEDLERAAADRLAPIAPAVLRPPPRASGCCPPGGPAQGGIRLAPRGPGLLPSNAGCPPRRLGPED